MAKGSLVFNLSKVQEAHAAGRVNCDIVFKQIAKAAVAKQQELTDNSAL